MKDTRIVAIDSFGKHLDATPENLIEAFRVFTSNFAKVRLITEDHGVEKIVTIEHKGNFRGSGLFINIE